MSADFMALLLEVGAIGVALIYGALKIESAIRTQTETINKLGESIATLQKCVAILREQLSEERVREALYADRIERIHSRVVGGKE